MGEKNWLISLGILVYIILSAIDRFLYKIPDYIYIPAAIVGIALILIGVKNKKRD